MYKPLPTTDSSSNQVQYCRATVTKKNKLPIFIFASLGLVLFTTFDFTSYNNTNSFGDQTFETADYDVSVQYANVSHVRFDGIKSAEWCQAPVEPPLDYDYDCSRETLMRFGIYGGLTNALNFLVKGGIWALKLNNCFYVDEGASASKGMPKMAKRAPPEENVQPFLGRYFEPIGLPADSEKMLNKEKYFDRIYEPDYIQIQFTTYGRDSGGRKPIDFPDRHAKHDIPVLDLYGKDNIWLKKYMLRRMIRFLPDKQNEACSRLNKLDLNKEYIALSVRRGDKALEYELQSSMQPYIDKAEIAIQSHFGGQVPKIFVASDDCTVLGELRSLRPKWNFVSECDNTSESNGFVINEMKDWTLKQTDDHYQKFITEMIAMASAKYFIGVATTNVSIFIYFMRHYHAADDTFTFVDAPGLVY